MLQKSKQLTYILFNEMLQMGSYDDLFVTIKMNFSREQIK